jgi:hypothetical protein
MYAIKVTNKRKGDPNFGDSMYFASSDVSLETLEIAKKVMQGVNEDTPGREDYKLEIILQKDIPVGSEVNFNDGKGIVIKE